jgi:hypothetical protein
VTTNVSAREVSRQQRVLARYGVKIRD